MQGTADSWRTPCKRCRIVTSTVHDSRGCLASVARPGSPLQAEFPRGWLPSPGARYPGRDVTPGPGRCRETVAFRFRSVARETRVHREKRFPSEAESSPRSPPRRSRRPGADRPRRRRAGRRRRAAGAMSQRQVLQGKSRGGRRPDGLAAGAAGAPGGLLHRVSPPQCSSSTRKPGPSSCRWWRSWRPDPKTSRRYRMRVSPHRFRVAQGPSPRLAGRSAPRALRHLVPLPRLAPRVPSHPGCSAFSRPLPPSPSPRIPGPSSARVPGLA